MKKIALILICVFLFVLATQMSMGQNSGPVAPEAASFEPIDATDMVDLLTGDFTYVLPLLEVPGPAGGYPVSLHYHAGTTLDLEASWVGLGWNLNPGSILRSVNGVADDYKGKSDFLYAYDKGGSYEAYSVGVGIGIPGSLSVGINGSWDSNKAWGAGLSVGAGIENSQWGINGSIGYHSTGGMSVGIGLGHQSGFRGGISNSSSGVGMSLGYKNLGFGIGPKGWGGSLSLGNDLAGVGISLSSDGVNVAPSVLGGFSASSSKVSMSDYTVLKSSANIPIMTPWFYVNFGYYKQKWYLRKLSSNKKYGPLYFSNFYDDMGTLPWLANKFIGMDVVEYELENSLSEVDDASVLPAYDSYHFSAQGLNGYMSPRRFESSAPFLIGTGMELQKNSKGSITHELDYYVYNDQKCTNPYDKVEFYFDYENGSNLIYTAFDSWKNCYAAQATPEAMLRIQGGSLNQNSSQYNSQINRLLNGNYIEWFTNREITDNLEMCRLKGFIEADGSIAPNDSFPNNPRKSTVYFDPDGIGAFTIVKSDGLRYHYSLPIYQFEICHKSSQKDDLSKYIVKFDPNKYATSWMLTAITGPDYVDNGIPGLSDDDYGYWVKLSYGKWTDGYIWKNKKTVNKTDFVTWGRKQVYYLNSIETKSHSAIFVKTNRFDGYMKAAENLDVPYTKSLSYNDYRKFEKGPNYYSYLTDDGSIRKEFISAKLDYRYQMTSNDSIPILCLDKILLFDKKHVNIDNGISGKICAKTYNNSKSNLSIVPSKVFFNVKTTTYEVVDDTTEPETWDYVTRESTESYNFKNPKSFVSSWEPSGNICLSENIIDDSDISSQIEKSALKIIKFSYDYDLHRGHTSSQQTNYTKNGKLTLNSIDFLGKGGAVVLPPYKFDYYRQTQGLSLKEDAWGFPVYTSQLAESNITSPGADDLYNKPEVKTGSLKSIAFPLGGELDIDYESDVYASPLCQVVQKRESMSVKDVLSNCTWSVPIVSIQLADSDEGIFLIRFKKPAGNIDLSSVSKIDGAKVEFDQMTDGINIFTITNIIPQLDENGQTSWYEGTDGDGYFYANIEGYLLEDDGFGNWVGDPSNEETQIKNTFGTNSPAEHNGSVYFCFNKFYGGGLRTSKLTLKNAGNIENEITYTYPNLGIAPQVPIDRESYMKFNGEMPSMGVYYDKVVVQNIGKNATSDGVMTANYFYVPQSLSVVETNDNFSTFDYPKSGKYTVKAYTTNSTLRDNKSAWGRLEKIEVSTLQSGLLSSTSYNYMTMDEIDANNQGVVSESFKSVRKESDHRDLIGGRRYNWFFNAITRKLYPNIVKSVTTVSAGLSKKVTYNVWDPYTGEVLETEYENSMGDKFRTRKVPAYTITGYSAMGPKALDSSNDNMLTQEAASYLYKIGPAGEEQPMAASIQTWNQNWIYRDCDRNYVDYSDPYYIWRKHKTFVWQGDVNTDGTYNAMSAFDWGNVDGNQNQVNGWRKLTEITRYSRFSAPLEAKDQNGLYSSSKTDANERVIATAGNARYTEFCATSMEDRHGTAPYSWFGGEVRLKSGEVLSTTNPDFVHTGTASLRIEPGNEGVYFEAEMNGAKRYHASVWVNKDAPESILVGNNGSSVVNAIKTSKLKFGTWYLISADFDVNTPKFTVTVKNTYSSTIYVDDFRCHPANAILGAYVYDEWGQLAAILDGNNIAVKYEYDAAGRLKSVFKETPDGFKKISQHIINYKELIPETDKSPETFPAPKMYIVQDSKKCTIDFSVSSSYPLTTNTTYEWDFGDEDMSSAKSGTHVYGKLGTFTVTLRTVNSYYGEKVQTYQVTFDKIWIVSQFYVTSGGGNVLNIRCEDHDQRLDVNYQINFGDGNIVTQKSPYFSHLYNSTGTYQISLIVTDVNGVHGSSSTSGSYAVLGNNPFSLVKCQSCTGLEDKIIRCDGALNDYGTLFYDLAYPSSVAAEELQVYFYNRYCEELHGAGVCSDETYTEFGAGLETSKFCEACNEGNLDLIIRSFKTTELMSGQGHYEFLINNISTTPMVHQAYCEVIYKGISYKTNIVTVSCHKQEGCNGL